MPNPVTSGTTQGYFDVANDDRRQTFVYQGPTGPIGYENGKPVYQVSSITKSYTTCSKAFERNLRRTEWRKHVPYVRSQDGMDPLAYSLLQWNYSYPLLSVHRCDIKHDHIGFPIDAPGTYLPAHKQAAGSMPAFTYATIDQALDNQAVSRLNESVSSQRDVAVNWAVNAFEAEKSVKMIHDRAKTIVNTLRNLRKGRFKRAYNILFLGKSDRKTQHRLAALRRTKDNAASLWLEWTYGWSPLMGDIHTAINDYQKAKREYYIRARGVAVDRSTQTIQTASSFGGGDFSPRVAYNISIQREALVKYTSVYSLSTRSSSKLLASGLVQNPLSVAWELVPFSFVADWFINVGDVLYDLSAAVGLQHMYTVKSTLLKTNMSSVAADVPFYHRQYSSFTAQGDASVKTFENRVEFTRTTSSTRPRVVLGLNKTPLSVTRTISSLALINNLIRGLYVRK